MDEELAVPAACPSRWRRSRPFWAPCSSTAGASRMWWALLKPEDFYLQQNREIYRRPSTPCSTSPQTIDPVTVLDKMKRAGVY